MINLPMNFEHHRHFIGTTVLAKFHENVAIKVDHRVSELDPAISGTKRLKDRGNNYVYQTNLCTKFHDDWAKIVTSKSVHKLFLLYKYKKTAPPPGSHVIQLTGTIFELNSHIKKTNVLINIMKIGPKM
ncbi:hypothetical protein DPMN_114853 [Dreissena polymorpha]|uniref:Uncharacterized protein n=1 Tax=Dreissena polymorpha TaxID=45954 RepID=A0A9D4QSF0_DREPO|nr:hypothetical protein DPMN_114853 [Dreissena polymorpha]